MKTFYYIYKITNSVNQKIYVGVHQTNSLDDGYMGSGLMLTRAIKKYGVANFKKEILEFFDNEQEMLAKEKTIVNEHFVSSELTYNLIQGGHGSFSYINSLPNQNHKPDQRKNASKLGNIAFKEKLKSDPNFKSAFSKKISDIMRDKVKNGTHMNPAKTHKWVSNIEQQKSMYVHHEKLEQLINDGWILGRKFNNHSNLGKKYKKRSPFSE